ncbi:MAG: hypothetical protein ACYC1Z_08230 [Georgenia sp.]
MPPTDVIAAAGVADAVGRLLLVIGIVALVLITGAALTTWYVMHRIRRSHRIRRGLERGGLAIRSVAGDRSHRQIARLRLDVRRSAEATERSLEAARGRYLGDTPFVAADLARVGRALDDRLRLAEREPDGVVRQTLRTGLEPRVREHTRLGAELRQALLGDVAAAGDARLVAAGSRLEVEVEALKTWGETFTSHRAV